VQWEKPLLNQLIKQGVNFTIVNEVIVIQHQHNILRHGGQIIDEQGSHTISWRELLCQKQAFRGLERIGKDSL